MATQVVRRWNVPQEEIVALERAYARVEALGRKKLNRYYDDPAAFISDCFEWREGEGPTDYQLEVASMLPVEKKVAQRAPRGGGKTATESMIALWFILTREAAAAAGTIRDFKVLLTAGGWAQITNFLFPEIHLWQSRLKWDQLGRAPFQRGAELLKLSIQLEHGRAFAVASSNPQRMEGAHADSMLVIADEAKAITDATFDALEGSLSGGREGFAFVSSTPGAPMGRFYDIHQGQKPGTDRWWTRHVTITEVIKAGRTTKTWVDEHRDLWGEDSAQFYNHVLGEFHADDETTIIPWSWVSAAIDRWNEHSVKSRLSRSTKTYWALPTSVDRIGADIARRGGDKTVFSLIAGYRVNEIHAHKNDTTDVTAKKLEALMDENPGAVAVIDCDGLGVGVFDQVHNKDGYKQVIEFHANAEAKSWKTAAGINSAFNTRSAMWLSMRDALDPRNNPVIELPTTPVLIGDLTAAKLKPSKGKDVLQVEAKAEMQKRLGRSPDYADSCLMGMYRPRPKKKPRMTFAGNVAQMAGRASRIH